jgi:hypothetical protein
VQHQGLQSTIRRVEEGQRRAEADLKAQDMVTQLAGAAQMAELAGVVSSLDLDGGSLCVPLKFNDMSAQQLQQFESFVKTNAFSVSGGLQNRGVAVQVEEKKAPAPAAAAVAAAVALPDGSTLVTAEVMRAVAVLFGPDGRQAKMPQLRLLFKGR